MLVFIDFGSMMRRMKFMNFSRVGVLGCAMLSLAGASPSQADTITGPALQQTLAGKTVVMSMSLGSLPIAYRANGTMSASSKAVGAATGVSKDTGRWWVSGRNLCQKWQKWFSGQQYCHAMSKKGETLFWVRNDGLAGTAKVLR